MRTILILFFLFLTNQVFSQKKLFDTLKIDAKTKIIGRYPQYDKSRTYEKYNFIIEDSIQIEKFIKNIKLGEEVANSTEDPSFELTVVKKYNEIGSWTINPTLKSAMTHDGHTYKFDLNQITKLNDEYPFSYYYEIKTFKSKDEYEIYLAKQKNNPMFLFDYAPLFRYEGSFEIEFKKSSQFPHPKAISDYLEPYIEKIVNKNEYSLTYILDSKNIENSDQYTMTISGPKKLFDELKINNLKNEHWQPTVEEAYLFYKK
ncbi:MAG: hypothetical protein JWQ63_1668 [Mucilaginibacter sp.]|nr:hypothetical protein [Mucilaginibacter sp.]